MSDLVSSIRESYQKTLEAIAASARKAGRAPNSVRLVVVTKLQPLEVVQAAIEAGARNPRRKLSRRSRPKNNGIEISNWR